MRTPTRFAASFRGRLALIVALALVLRVLYTVLATRSVEGLGDYQFFHGVAGTLAHGDGFANPFLIPRGEVRPTALHPPLWPLLLGGSSVLGAGTEMAHKLVGTLVGTGAVAVIGLLGRRVGGSAVGLTAAGLAAVYPLFIGSDGSLMSESLYGLLVATVMLLALRLAERPTLSLAAALGAVIGLAALTRTEGLAFLVLLVVPVAWMAADGLGRRAALVSVCILGAVVVIAPWTLRNAFAFDGFVPISTNEGTVLAGANCSKTYGGKDLGGWRFTCVSEFRNPNEGEQAKVWRREGLDYARDHAGRLPKVVAARLLRTWNLFPPWHVVVNEGRTRWIALLETIMYFLLIPLAAWGVVLLARRRIELVVLLSPVVVVTLVSAYGWGLTRFRIAADVAMVVLAAVALVELGRRVATRRQLPSSAA